MSNLIYIIVIGAWLCYVVATNSASITNKGLKDARNIAFISSILGCIYFILTSGFLI